MLRQQQWHYLILDEALTGCATHFLEAGSELITQLCRTPRCCGGSSGTT